MPFCKKCGMGINSGSTVCKHCGASQVPAKPWIDSTLIVIILLEIVMFTVFGLWNGSLTGYIFAIIGIVANLGIFGIDLILRRAQRQTQ